MAKSKEKQIADLYDELDWLTFGEENADPERIKFILDKLDELAPLPPRRSLEESLKEFWKRAEQAGAYLA